MQTALFLDFDGVVLRNHPAHKHIAQRCTSFVNKHVPFYNPLKAVDLNKCLYTTYGHTLKGLQKINSNVSAQEFNASVYGYFPYTKYFSDIKSTHAQDIKDIQKLLFQCQEINTPVYIFSNSPDEWCNTIMEFMGLSLPPSTRMLCADHLKPEIECYSKIENAFNNYKLVFVDDSFINFKNIMDSSRWIKVYMSSEFQMKALRLREDLFIISDIKQTSDILHIKGP
jgi:FMN phosphatase YigB (HAD superfamily)